MRGGAPQSLEETQGIVGMEDWRLTRKLVPHLEELSLTRMALFIFRIRVITTVFAGLMLMERLPLWLAMARRGLRVMEAWLQQQH